MKKFLVTGALAAVCAATMVAGTSATADTDATKGQITVFSTEFTELNTWEEPTGCAKLPPAAHVLINQTDGPVRIYGDPLCLTPAVTVRPGYGSHVAPGSGSFSVAE